MAEKIQLDVVTPSRRLVSAKCDDVYAPGARGEFGVLLQHAPLITMLTPGLVRYKVKNEEKWIAVRSGFAHVSEDKMIILADEAMLASDSEANEIGKRSKEVEAKLVAADVSVEERAQLFLERDWLNVCSQLQ